MKRILSVIAGVFIIAGMIGMAAMAGELPESVQRQSRKDDQESAEWTQFDKAGPVKFLQVQHTAAASPTESAAQLDGSIGERLIEVKLDPSITGDVLAWSLENKGPGVVWIVAASDGSIAEALELQPDAIVELEVAVTDGYVYLVVDSDGTQQTAVIIKAAAGDTAAKTVVGGDMRVEWF
jgi:hypothetical protein